MKPNRKRQTVSRLRLSSESIRLLGADELRLVDGGDKNSIAGCLTAVNCFNCSCTGGSA